MTKKVTTKVDGQDYEESCTLEELITWSNGRWIAGQHEASLNIEKRAEALAKVTLKGKKYSLDRNDEGILELKSGEPAPMGGASIDAGGGS